jgi:hypothetical protein
MRITVCSGRNFTARIMHTGPLTLVGRQLIERWPRNTFVLTRTQVICDRSSVLDTQV